MATQPATASASRAFAPDLARGFMLLLIAAANVSWFLYGREASATGSHLVGGSVLDQVMQTIMLIAVDGRAYPLFALLFGYGMVQFTRSRIARGIEYRDIRRMLRRRHWAMILVFGLPHAALLFMGDVLGAYGLVGLILVAIFFNRRDRALWIAVWVLAGLMAFFALFSVVGGVATSLFVPEGAADPAVGADFARDLTVATDNYLMSVVGRLMMWVTAGVGQAFFSAVPVCVLLGWLAARHQVLEDPGRHRRLLTRVAFIGIPVGWLGGVPGALAHLGVIELPSWTFTGIGTVLGAVGALGYAALFGLLAIRRPSAPATWIAAVGKRSLSFYLLQSVIFAPLLSAWGFGLGAVVGTAGALGIAAAVWLLSLAIAVVMEQRGARGPAEMLLRRLTYGKRQQTRV